VLILGPADERLVRRMMTLAKKIGAVTAHNLRLRLLAAVLSKCGAYVGNDSGVTHLATATGIPTLAIFGPTDPAVWAPLGRNVKVVSSTADCSPCAREAMHRCRERACLEEIEVEAVVRAVETSVGHTPP
jgi:ADP-heptose:LPS heptosyltransferase